MMLGIQPEAMDAVKAILFTVRDGRDIHQRL
ncbi:MAG: hypothetical protein QOK48_2057 [Blastocatellia bacterium]|jgi:hypothetical protein|nr:hypothetical protein [Blastocatellia bacterium]